MWISCIVNKIIAMWRVPICVSVTIAVRSLRVLSVVLSEKVMSPLSKEVRKLSMAPQCVTGMFGFLTHLILCQEYCLLMVLTLLNKRWELEASSWNSVLCKHISRLPIPTLITIDFSGRERVGARKLSCRSS